MTISALALSLALGAVSTSDLGVVLVGPGGGAVDLLAACPTAVKAGRQLSGASAGGLLRTYQQQCAGGDGLAELPALTFAPTLLTTAGGEADARTYFGFSVAPFVPTAPSMLGVLPGDLRWVSGPENLFDQVVDPSTSPAHAAWAAGFVAELARLVRAEATTRGGDFDLLVPPWSNAAPGAFCEVLLAARAAEPSVGWTWRATSVALSSSLPEELQTTFGYRSVRDACAVTGMPIFVELTAAGGWLAGGRQPAAVMDWLRFVDETVDADADVTFRGAVLLRALGTTGPEDLSAVVPLLASYLADPAAPPPDGGGGGTGGVAGPPTPSGGGGNVGEAGGSGCGNAGGALALLGLAPLLRLRRRRA
jgi:hypothetical protein